MKPKLIITIFIILVTGGLVFVTFYYKPHRNPKSEQGITISASDLFNQFATNEVVANSLYLDRVLVVTGNVKTTTRNQQNMPVLTLETGDDFFGVLCTLTDNSTEIKANDFVAIKGICKGFLSDVVITDASLTDNEN